MINQRENYGIVEKDNSYVEMPQAAAVVSDSLFQIIWRHRWTVLLTTVVVLAAAFIYLAKATPIYTSTSRIYVEQTGPKIITETEGVMTQSKNYLYTQAELLKSTPILAAALDVPGVREMKVFAKVDNPITYLNKKGLDVTVGKKDDIISVSSDSPYPAEAAQLVNSVVDSYITYHATRKRSTSAEVLKILQEGKVKWDNELAQMLRAMMDFKKENTGLGLESTRGNIILERLARLSEALTQAQLSTIDAKSAYEMTRAMIDDPAKVKEFVEAELSTEVFRSVANEKARLEAELDRFELQLADLIHQLTLTTDHPAVKEVASKITRIKKQITDLDEEFARSQLSVAHQQYLAAKEKEDQIRKYLEEQREQAFALNEQTAEYTILQSGWEQTKKLCDILDDRIKELNVTEDVGVLNISILEVARPADEPSKPQKARIMAMALVLALMLGGSLALLRDGLDYRLRSAEEISAILGIPVLGVIPTMSEKQTIVARSEKVYLESKSILSETYRTIRTAVFSGVSKGEIKTAVVTPLAPADSKSTSKKQTIVTRGQKVHLDSKSHAAEAYRTVRTAVLFGVPKDEAKTVLVTSPGAGDGKTTLVSNLAIAMAQAGQKTLIIDADFRNPMQDDIFEVDQDKGLASVLAGTVSLNDAIQPTGVDGLDLLTCGPDVPNPSEMLNSEAFAETLEHLSNKYDRIVIDSPPVMPVTDAQILAAICDVAILVLRAGKSTRKLSQQARDGLLSVGAHILGAVVNDVSRKSGGYGYYYDYGYFSHGRPEKEKASDRKPAAVMEGPGSDETSND